MVSMSFAGILMMLLGGGANDLLDLVHTDSYWKAKQVTVSIEQLVGDATARIAPGEPGASRAAEVRRLMAIRTLGEMKQADGAAALQPLLDSKEPFVADYARAAIASIQGKPAARPAATAAARMTDVWLLPAQCDLVAQAAMAGIPIRGGDLLGDAPLPPGMNKAEMLEKMTTELIPVVEMVENVRLEALTVGLYSNAPNQPGYAVIVARGRYDAKAASAALGQHQVSVTTVADMEVFQPDKSVALILASDTRAVLVIGDANGTLPLESVVAAIKKDAGGLHDNVEMTKLIAKVDTSQAMWGVVKMTDGLRQVVPAVAAFDTGILLVSAKDDVLSFSLKAEGSDAERVRVAVDEANTRLQEGIQQIRKTVVDFPAAKPILDALESVKLECEGSKASATGSLKEPMSLPLMLFGIRSEVGRPAPAGPAGRPTKPGGL